MCIKDVVLNAIKLKLLQLVIHNNYYVLLNAKPLVLTSVAKVSSIENLIRSGTNE